MWVEGARDGKWDWEKMGQVDAVRKGQVGVGTVVGRVERAGKLDGGWCLSVDELSWCVVLTAMGWVV